MMNLKFIKFAGPTQTLQEVTDKANQLKDLSDKAKSIG